MTATSGRAVVRARPCTASFTVPSPPTTTSSAAPSSAAWRASFAMWPGLSEKNTSPLRPRLAARCAISGQRVRVDPFADAGLTRKTVSLMAGRGGERDSRHPVDRRLELGVGDPHELALDDDVAHGQQAPSLHASQGRDGEERRRLHFDGEDPPLRPALVLAAV